MGAEGGVTIYRASEVREKFAAKWPGHDIDVDWWYLKTITATLDGVDWILDYGDDQGFHEGTGNDFWFAYEAGVKNERREGDWQETSAAQHRVLSVLRECAHSYTEVWT
jgi:hypothetical protein